MEREEVREEGLIPKMFKKWQWKKKFTKSELEELDKIKKESFMIKMREKAKKEGTKLANEEIKEGLK